MEVAAQSTLQAQRLKGGHGLPASPEDQSGTMPPWRGSSRDTRVFSASLRFTPSGLARKKTPGVFVVIPRERRATPSGGFTGATSAAPPAGPGLFFGHAALSVAYVG